MSRSRWEAQPIYIYFCDKYDTGEENCLPYNPDKFMFHIAGQDEEFNMLDGPVTVLKDPKLIEYEPIESFFTHPDVPRYMKSKETDDWTPKKWEDFFISAIKKRKVLEMTITGVDYVDEVLVADFSWGKKAYLEKETYYTLKIKQHKDPKIEHENILIQREMPKTDLSNNGAGGGAGTISEKRSPGATLWLRGKAWRGFSTFQGLSNPVMLNGGVATLRWLKVIKLGNQTINENKLTITDLSEKIISKMKGIQNKERWDYLKNAIELYAENDLGNLETLFETFFIKKMGTKYYKNKWYPDGTVKLFFKTLINPDDLSKLNTAKKNRVTSTEDSEAIGIAIDSVYTSLIRGLNNTYCNNSKETKLAQVKVVDGMAKNETYKPDSNSFSDSEVKVFETGEVLWCRDIEKNIDLCEENPTNEPFTYTYIK